MPKYKIECSSGFASITETIVVDAQSPEDAEAMAEDWWMQELAPDVGTAEEIENNDDGYTEIN
jgi:hypothetical protein